MARIDSFLRLVVEQQASDLHFHAGKVPLIRHHGELLPLPFRALSETETLRFLMELLDPEQRAIFEERHEFDLLYALPGVGRFRVNLFLQSYGAGAVFRIIPDRPPLLDVLGFPATMRRITTLSSGLVLIGGPTGSGKTTTLSAIVHEINRNQQRHILTIEEPIEFLHEPLMSAITQRQVGLHVDSFADALRSAMRAAPDVIVVGELREFETLNLALQAAEAGALVFGTLHTNSAAKTLLRVLDMAPDDARDHLRASLATHLRALVAQHLIRRQSGDGRIAAIEVLVNTPAAASMIREGKVAQLGAWLQTQAPDTGCQSLDACLLHYVKEGHIDAASALELCEHRDGFRKSLDAFDAVSA